MLHLLEGNETEIRGRKIISQHDMLRLSVIKTKNNPSVNHGHINTQDIQEEYTYNYEGAVYCISVPSEVFYVRRNGICVWTGNSRSSNGPIVMLTRQPIEMWVKKQQGYEKKDNHIRKPISGLYLKTRYNCFQKIRHSC
jgi:hypothetical protein